MNYLQKLIERFWRGDASERERRQLLDELNHRTLEIRDWCQDDFGATKKSSAENLNSEQKEAVLGKLHERIRLIELTKQQRSVRLNRTLKFLSAAVIILALGTLFTIRYQNGEDASDKTEQVANSIISRRNTGDRVDTVILPDRSRVWLSPGSSIQYTRDFNISHRNLSLKGDAKFEVQKNPDRPFSVEAKGYQVTALGTVFHVSSSDKDRLLVQLLSGKVVVRANTNTKRQSEGYFMIPGDELHINLLNHHAEYKYNDDQAGLSSSKEELSRSRKFPSGTNSLILHFNETPLPTVLDQIESIYKVSIDYEGSELSTKTFTGRLPIYDRIHVNSIQQTIALLSQEYEFQYTIKNNKIIIKKIN